MKIGYLTIDDCPTDDFRNKVNFLLEKKIPAIFFCIGRCINEDRRDSIIYAIKNGFLVGSHSWNHKNFSKITENEIREEITKADDLLNQLYSEAGIKREIKLFRFPYLNKGEKNRGFAQKVLKELGYKQPKFENINVRQWGEEDGDLDVSCTHDTMDWTVADGSKFQGIETLEDMFDRMDKDDKNNGLTLNDQSTNEIIMMHDDDRIKDMFELIIQKLIDKGIKFEGVGK